MPVGDVAVVDGGTRVVVVICDVTDITELSSSTGLSPHAAADTAVMPSASPAVTRIHNRVRRGFERCIMASLPRKTARKSCIAASGQACVSRYSVLSRHGGVGLDYAHNRVAQICRI